MKWYPWAELISMQVVLKNSGYTLDRVVKTPVIESCYFNLSLLSDNGCPILLIGESGSGKSLLIKERLKALCSGDVTDILNITIDVNIYTKTKDIANRINNNIQWEHGKVYTPIGNKKLIIFLDDINSSGKNSDGVNTVNEFTRELFDSDAFWHYNNTQNETSNFNSDLQESLNVFKKELKNINIMGTLNSKKISNIDQRMLRHFNIIHLPKLSMEDEKTIFSVLVKGHLFGTTMTRSEIGQSSQIPNYNMSEFIDQLIHITLDLQKRLNQQFQLVSKPVHYSFNLYNLVQLFYNFCEVITCDSTIPSLLYTWRNECNWNFECRMVDRVHKNKYIEAYESAIKAEIVEKYKAVDLPMIALMDSNLPIFSNIRSGSIQNNCSKMKSSNMSFKSENENEISNRNSVHNSSVISNTSKLLSNYGPIANETTLENLLQAYLNEYNKIYPPIHIHMHRTNMNIISRISRILTLNENMGHCLIVADGSPGLSTNLLNLSAHISGYRVVYSHFTTSRFNPYTVETFKKELNNIFTMSGCKNDKTVMVLRDGDLAVPGVVQCIRDIIIYMSIDDLFTVDQKTHITNNMKLEVVKSGLNYSKDVAWKYFIQNLIRNFRFVIIINNCHSAPFHSWMKHNYKLIEKMNLIWNICWNKQELLNISRYIMNRFLLSDHDHSENEKENYCYLLYNIHSTTQEFDMTRNSSSISDPVNKFESDSIGPANNATFENLVVKFCQFVKRKKQFIDKENDIVAETFIVISEQEQLTARLFSQLNHEKQVLQDKIDAATSILNQIGENTLIVQSQMRTIRYQIDEIKQLKKLVPEYKIAHDRYSYKAIAAFNRAREVVKNIDIDNLNELRATHNPVEDVIELIGTIIMILKSPFSDMTWNTGGKRLLANLERFTLELLTFDEKKITNETLNLLETRLKNSSMQPDSIKEKSGMSCCEDLCRWVHYVSRYYKIMQNKVKPLHHKLENTTKDVSEAEIRMKLLEDKQRNLNSRLQDLSKNFEQATLDRYNQEIKNAKITEMLITSKKLIEILKNEKQNAVILKSSYQIRKSNVIGSCAITAAFLTYLGYFEVPIRRDLLTIFWPRCLQERGLSLVFDIVDKIEGLKILFEYPLLDQVTTSQDRKLSGNLNEESESTTSSGSKDVYKFLLQDEEYDHLIRAIASLVLNRGIDNYLELETLRNADLQQTILLVGNNDKFPLIFDPSGFGMKYYTSNLELLHSLMSDESGYGRMPSLKILNMDLTSPQIIQDSLEEAVINGHHAVIRAQQPNIEMFITFIQFYLSKHLKTRELDANYVTINNMQVMVDSRFRSILVADQINSMRDNEFSTQINFVNWKVTEDQIIDIIVEKCVLNIGDNFSIIRSRKMANEKYCCYLKILLQELQLTLMNFSRARGKLWNDENIKMLETIIDGIQKAQLKIKEYNEFLITINESKLVIKKQLMKLEAILQCIMNMGKINSNICFTPTTFLEIFDQIFTESNELAKSDSLRINTNDELETKSQLVLPEKPSTNMKIDEKSILKWSLPDQMLYTEDSKKGLTDEKDFNEQLLISIDNEEKEILAQEITGIKLTKHELKLKGFGFYMDRRGIIRPRPWKPKCEFQNEDSITLKVQQDQIFYSENLKQIHSIVNEINKDNFISKNEFQIISEERIKSAINMVELGIFNRLKLCLSSQEFLIYRFIYYFWLSEDPMNAPTALELEFFIQVSLNSEMKLSLTDFNCTDTKPNWIPKHIWDEILAVSIVPGFLEDLYLKVIENSEKWKSWFDIDDIEDCEFTPLDSMLTSSDTIMCSKTYVPKFSRLILLKIFRPDRCKILMDKISLEKITQHDHCINFDNFISQIFSVKCIIISKYDSMLVPSFENESILDIIHRFAKNRNLTTSFINYAIISMDQLSYLIEKGIKNSDWIVITLSEHDLKNITMIINRFMKLLTSKLVWLIGKETNKILKCFHSDVLNSVFVLSEENLKLMANQDMEKCNSVIRKVFHCALSSFYHHNNLLMEIMNKYPEQASAIIWRLIYINSVIMLRLLLGCRGMAMWTQIPNSLVKDQLLYLISNDLQSCFDRKISTDAYFATFVDFTFSKIYVDNTDVLMIKTISQKLFQHFKNEAISINEFDISFPVFHTDLPTNFNEICKQSWFTDNNLNKITCTEFEGSMNVNSSATLTSISAIESFLNILNKPSHLEQSVLIDNKYISKSNKRIWSISKNILRTKALYILEKLPSLINSSSLNLERLRLNSSSVLAKSDCREIEKTNKIDKFHENEQIKFAKLILTMIWEEISVFNLEICKIRTNLHHLFGSLEEDLIDMTEHLINIFCDLVEERVPQTWNMLTKTIYSPSTHSLFSYIEFIIKRHHQLMEWHQKFEALSNNALVDFNLVLSTSLWLGGLKNPKIFLSGIRYNYSISKNIHLHEIKILAKMSENNKLINNTDIIDLYLVGACVKLETNKIVISKKKMINPLEKIHLEAILFHELDQKHSYYNCPIYKDLARTQFVDYFLFPCDDIEGFILSGVFVALEKGIDHKQIKRKRVPVLIPPYIHVNESPFPSISLANNPYGKNLNVLHTLMEEDENLDLPNDIISRPVSSDKFNKYGDLNQSENEQNSPFLVKQYSPVPPEMGLIREKQNLIDGNVDESYESSETSMKKMDDMIILNDTSPVIVKNEPDEQKSITDEKNLERNDQILDSSKSLDQTNIENSNKNVDNIILTDQDMVSMDDINKTGDQISVNIEDEQNKQNIISENQIHETTYQILTSDMSQDQSNTRKVSENNDKVIEKIKLTDEDMVNKNDINKTNYQIPVEIEDEQNKQNIISENQIHETTDQILNSDVYQDQLNTRKMSENKIMDNIMLTDQDIMTINETNKIDDQILDRIEDEQNKENIISEDQTLEINDQVLKSDMDQDQTNVSKIFVNNEVMENIEVTDQIQHESESAVEVNNFDEKDINIHEDITFKQVIENIEVTDQIQHERELAVEENNFDEKDINIHEDITSKQVIENIEVTDQIQHERESAVEVNNFDEKDINIHEDITSKQALEDNLNVACNSENLVTNSLESKMIDESSEKDMKRFDDMNKVDDQMSVNIQNEEVKTKNIEMIDSDISSDYVLNKHESAHANNFTEGVDSRSTDHIVSEINVNNYSDIQNTDVVDNDESLMITNQNYQQEEIKEKLDPILNIRSDDNIVTESNGKYLDQESIKNQQENENEENEISIEYQENFSLNNENN